MTRRPRGAEIAALKYGSPFFSPGSRRGFFFAGMTRPPLVWGVIADIARLAAGSPVAIGPLFRDGLGVFRDGLRVAEAFSPVLTGVSEGAYSPAWRPQNFVTDSMLIPTVGGSSKDVPVARTLLFGIMPRRARLWNT